MNQDPVRVARVDFEKVIPALRLWRAVPLGLTLRVLLPSIAAAGLSWVVMDRSDLMMSERMHRIDDQLADLLPAVVNRFLMPVIVLSQGLDGGALVAAVLQAVTVGVFGVIISRSVGLAVARHEWCGPLRSSWYAMQNLRALAMTVGLLFLFQMVATFVSGFLLWLSGGPAEFDSMIGLLWPGLAGGVLFGSLWLFGLSWLLSLAAVGIDRDSGADAFSRSISYVLSRFLSSVLLVCVASQLAWAVSAVVTEVCAELLNLSLLVGFPYELQPSKALQDEMASVLRMVSTVVQFSVFMSAITIGYLLLRESVDGIPIDEVSGRE